MQSQTHHEIIIFHQYDFQTYVSDRSQCFKSRFKTLRSIRYISLKIILMKNK